MTPNDLILECLREAGVLGIGQPAGAEDVNSALFRLNLMLGQWSKKRWLVYHLVDVTHTATGALSYTVGPGGDFNIPRADKLEAAYFRQLNTSVQTDFPLTVIQAREDYNAIRLKSLKSWPTVAFLDTGYPLGTLYVWPVPSAQYELHITVKETLGQVTLTQTLNLPDEYRAAIFYNLGCRLRSAYQLAPDPSLVAFAKDALGVIRQANIQVPEASLPYDLTRNGPSYNIYSDI